jgi:hypothetical protein
VEVRHKLKLKRRAPARQFNQMPGLASGFAVLIGIGGVGHRIVLTVVVVWISTSLFVMRSGLLLLLTGLLDRLRLVLSSAGGRIFLVIVFVGHFELLWLGDPAHR